MGRERNRWAAIAWAPFSRRSEMFARELGGKLHCVHYLKFQSPRHAPLKYVLQAIRTLHVLFRERPEAVHVQSPPFVCGLIVSAYCLLSGARFVVEYHSAAFGRAWDWALPVQKLIARRAAVNIVTNEHSADIVRSWGGRVLVMYDAFLDLPDGEAFAVGPGFNIAFVSTFAPDEPVDAVLEAAALLPDIHFYVTGDTAKAPSSALASASANVTFTGLLDPNREYLGLLRAVDAVMVLTTRDHTLQLAGCEAISVGKPLITSDWPYLQELFARGAVFVNASPESIRDGIATLAERCDELASETPRLRQDRRRQWNTRLVELNRLVSSTGRNEMT
jgi:glycosyltransferase involved in cell wall biosynthesis